MFSEEFLEDIWNNCKINEYYVGGKCYRWNEKENRMEVKKELSPTYREFG